MINKLKLTALAIFTIFSIAYAQNATPDYSFSLGKTNYFMMLTKGSAKAKNDTVFYNLYRMGNTKRIAKEVKSVVNKTTNDTLKTVNFETAKNNIYFYIFGKNKPVIHHIYTQNTKGLLKLKTTVFEDKSAGMGVVEAPLWPQKTPTPPTAEHTGDPYGFDIPAEYPGGINKAREFIANNLLYPEEAQENDIEGTVKVKFIIEKDGSLTNIEIVNKLGYGCNEEVIRVLKRMPKWRPGTLKGKIVRTQFALPVSFRME